MLQILSVVWLSLLTLSACNSFEAVKEKPFSSSRSVATHSKSQGNFKIGTPYHQSGKWYTPRESYSYDETGIASWYGDQFHGKRTANGEIFDKNALTAAHPTLQLPALVRVTNLQNGRSAVLRVNDRGPFSKSRLIDVSHRAANVLGFDAQGTAKVRIQVLERESRILADAARKGHPAHVQMAMAFKRTPEVEKVVTQSVQVAEIVDDTVVKSVSNTEVVTSELPAPTQVSRNEVENLNKELFRKYPVMPTSIYVQAGAFSSLDNATALKNKLASFGQSEISQTMVNGKPFHRVRIGPLASVPAADSTLKKVLNAGISSAKIIVD